MKTVQIIAVVIITLALNIAVNWLIVKFLILPIAASLGADLPFWPVFFLTWVVAALFEGGVSVSTRKN